MYKKVCNLYTSPNPNAHIPVHESIQLLLHTGQPISYILQTHTHDSIQFKLHILIYVA